VNELGESGIDHTSCGGSTSAPCLMKSGASAARCAEDCDELRDSSGSARPRRDPRVRTCVVGPQGAEPAPVALHDAIRAPSSTHSSSSASSPPSMRRTAFGARKSQQAAARRHASSCRRRIAAQRSLVGGTRAQLNPAARVLEASFGNVEAGDVLFAPAEHPRRSRGFRRRRRSRQVRR